MIEVRIITHSYNTNYHLIIGGIPFRANVKLRTNGTIHASVYNSVVVGKILDHRFSDFGGYLYSLDFVPENYIVGRDEIDEKIVITKIPHQTGWHLSFDFRLVSSGWKYLWSIKEYANEFSRVVAQRHDSETQHTFTFKSINEFSVTVIIPEQGNLIRDEIFKHSKVLGELHSIAMQSLKSKLHSDTVTMYFDFPDGVRVPCEQYLLYFSQFLKDIGVEASAELQHEAGQVLFAVTPKDNGEALDKIREALSVYLNLAASPVNPASLFSNEIEVQRLAANIQHLQGQLTLAHAVLQAKDATIQLQQATIFQQHRIIGGEIIIESVKDVTPPPKQEDKEELLGGTVALTKANWKGVEFNLPEIFRRLRRLFKEE